ncbi:MAG TPA: SDR family oxidoreductase [Ktedonobacterales bacterium]|jgi:NAD(P)-dependent dehydrogenase (short-subunit alcohol dehydrogenase family)
MDTSAALSNLFSLRGRTALVMGGSGALGRAMAHGLSRAGARVVIAGRRVAACEEVAAAILADGGEALVVACDVLDRTSLEAACHTTEAAFGPVEILVNAAGGNAPGATATAEQPFFTLDQTSVTAVLGSNFEGTFLSCQVFGRAMAEHGQGSIVNIASMSALRPLTRIAAYSAAKAAVVNFTQWLATHLAQEYSPRLRVNALAPGFFLTEQNRYLLTDPQSGEWTTRGQAILAHTPMGRLGEPDDLIGTLVWLVSPAAAFVTGAVIPVDGGFAAYSGV